MKEDEVAAEPAPVAELPPEELLPAIEDVVPAAAPPLPASQQERGSFSAAAHILKEDIAKKSAVSLDALAAQQNISRSALERHLSAVAEAAVKNSSSVCADVLRYVSALHQAGALEPLTYTTHFLFDETPLPATVRFRTEGAETEKAVERAKLFVVEQEWLMLLKRSEAVAWPDPNPLHVEHPLVDDQYLLLMGRHSPSVRAAERTTGEGIAAVLSSVMSEPLGVDAFHHRCELAECDEYGANARALALINANKKSTWMSTMVLCNAHKLHAAAEKTWQMHSMVPIISGITHAGLFLRKTGKVQMLRKALRHLVTNWPLRVIQNQQSSIESTRYRNLCLKLWGPPPQEQPRRAALAQLISSKLLNGNWQRHGHLEHHCDGPGCCEDVGDLRAKLKRYIPKLLVACRMEVFQPNNWKDWLRGMRAFGLMHALHGLLGAAFTNGFSPTPLEQVHLIKFHCNYLGRFRLRSIRII